ncbi:hypothetical protein NC661_19700 [Aquibacillus koreensis]|uniref:Uncharacterized protein n=1 Tax=Aquibacillus koreensis TaxID=279446 RepID=A0A9X3WMP1_9BACI|nr:hypothetical protein [Aquibacillus koreensis]MCT2534190.1 hypothetical protein [Aquibacillus koreensis]MDC3422582.1 hypothetical protein [Aquibacillus koreensis]
MRGKSETEQLLMLLTDVHNKGNAGATLKEIMIQLKEELPKITKQKEYSMK